MREKSFKCPVAQCPQRYATRYNVQRHLNSAHPGFVLNECPRCQQVLSSRQTLRQHLAIHTGERPYRCQFCLQQFRQSSQLSQHRKQHYLEVRQMPIPKVRPSQLTALMMQSRLSLHETEEASQVNVKLPEIRLERQYAAAHLSIAAGIAS